MVLVGRYVVIFQLLIFNKGSRELNFLEPVFCYCIIMEVQEHLGLCLISVLECTCIENEIRIFCRD